MGLKTVHPQEWVTIWDVLHRKGPLTVDQIADEIRGVPGIPNLAMMTYRESLPEHLQPTTDRPGNEYQRAAVRYLVATSLTKMNQSGRLVAVRADDGGRARSGPHAHEVNIYSASLPPNVEVWRPVRRIERYDPDEYRRVNAAAAAGRRFTGMVGPVLARPDLPDDAREALQLAEQAIRVRGLDDPQPRSTHA